MIPTSLSTTKMRLYLNTSQIETKNRGERLFPWKNSPGYTEPSCHGRDPSAGVDQMTPLDGSASPLIWQPESICPAERRSGRERSAGTTSRHAAIYTAGADRTDAEAEDLWSRYPKHHVTGGTWLARLPASWYNMFTPSKHIMQGLV